MGRLVVGVTERVQEVLGMEVGRNGTQSRAGFAPRSTAEAPSASLAELGSVHQVASFFVTVPAQRSSP